MATPASRIFVLYIGGAADPGAWDAKPTPRALNEVAKRGCSGFLVLPGTLTTKFRWNVFHRVEKVVILATKNEANAEATLKTVLGVDEGIDGHSGAFQYDKIPVAFFSDSDSACSLAKSAGLKSVHHVPMHADHEAVCSQMNKLLAKTEDIKAKQLVFFHLSDYHAEHWVYSFLETLLSSEATGSSDDCFVSSVQAARRPLSTDPMTATHPLRPRQSYERHQGQYPASSAGLPRRLLVSSYHYDRTRRDDVTAFEESEIEQHGAYGAMDARIFMKEMAFRLGFAPKYGA